MIQMTDGELTQAELFDVFSNARRRRTVAYLKRTNGTCSLSSLVERIAAWENGVDPESVSRAQRRRVYISLYQTHLPMLEAHGIVDWDPDEHTIVLLPDDEVFDPYLGRVPGDHRDWGPRYAAVATGTAVLLGFSWLAIGPLGVWAAPIVAFLCCLVVLAMATVQLRSHGRRALPLSLVSSKR